MGNPWALCSAAWIANLKGTASVLHHCSEHMNFGSA
jgi:hypothetical protein